jgi:putative PLP-dependent aminotransferase (TIGR04422 family)
MPRESSGGVWGKPKKYKPSLYTSTPAKIETLLMEKFLGGFPVVLSSGRGAIKLIVQEFWSEKEISIFQYASQCVVQAVQAAGVTPYSRTNFTSELTHNQWGQLDLGCKKPPFIEDSCDTFLPEGASVLRLGAQFEIWSLPKILHSRFGAIVWCRNHDDAKILRQTRDTAKQWSLTKQIFRNTRNLSNWNYAKWQIIEFRTPQLSKYEYGSIFKDISEWGNKFNERQKLIQEVSILLNKKDFKSEIEAHASPVLLLDIDEETTVPFLAQSNIQIMHKIQSGKKPQKIRVYKVLGIRRYK